MKDFSMIYLKRSLIFIKCILVVFAISLSITLFTCFTYLSIDPVYLTFIPIFMYLGILIISFRSVKSIDDDEIRISFARYLTKYLLISFILTYVLFGFLLFLTNYIPFNLFTFMFFKNLFYIYLAITITFYVICFKHLKSSIKKLKNFVYIVQKV